MIRIRRALGREQTGSALVEFALVLPVVLVLLMGLCDLAFQAYVQAVLTGAVQKAGRDSTLQGSSDQAAADAIDNKIRTAVLAVARTATVRFARANFDTYGAMAGEPFIDTKYPNSSGTYDGICNHNEQYTDVNKNGRYDLDLSADGQGGANDVTRYQVTLSYNRLFPVARWIGWGSSVALSATTLLKNQPYATQTVNSGTDAGTCP